MQRYFLAGLVCLAFWLFIEPHLYAAVFYVRYRLIYKARLRTKDDGAEKGPLGYFMTGFIGALVFAFWPIYVVVTIARFLSLIFGKERLVHQ